MTDEQRKAAIAYMAACRETALASPTRITTVKRGRFWEITRAELDPVPEEWLDEVPSEVFEEAAF